MIHGVLLTANTDGKYKSINQHEFMPKMLNNNKSDAIR